VESASSSDASPVLAISGASWAGFEKYWSYPKYPATEVANVPSATSDLNFVTSDVFLGGSPQSADDAAVEDGPAEEGGVDETGADEAFSGTAAGVSFAPSLAADAIGLEGTAAAEAGRGAGLSSGKGLRASISPPRDFFSPLAGGLFASAG
jgi:hypothetical protein